MPLQNETVHTFMVSFDKTSWETFNNAPVTLENIFIIAQIQQELWSKYILDDYYQIISDTLKIDTEESKVFIRKLSFPNNPPQNQ